MKIKFLTILGIFLLLFTSCSSPSEKIGLSQQEQPGNSGGFHTPDKINDTRYAGTLDEIGDGYLLVTSDGEQNRFTMGVRTLQDIASLEITEGSRIIVEFDRTEGGYMVTQIEKLLSE